MATNEPGWRLSAKFVLVSRRAVRVAQLAVTYIIPQKEEIVSNSFVNFLTGAALTALLLFVGHWFPWKAKRIHAYIYGVASIWLGFAYWRIREGDVAMPASLLALACVAGFAVILAYAVDEIRIALRKARLAERHDPDL